MLQESTLRENIDEFIEAERKEDMQRIEWRGFHEDLAETSGSYVEVLRKPDPDTIDALIF